jgi:Protein of unknown function (DUF3892)
MVYVTARHMVGGERHEHIAQVRWRNPVNGETGTSTRAVMVDFIANKDGDARVSDGNRDARVGVVQPRIGAPFIRTYADGAWTDNLLALPRY